MPKRIKNKISSTYKIFYFFIKAIFVTYFVLFCIDNSHDIKIILPLYNKTITIKVFVFVIGVIFFIKLMAITIRVFTKIMIIKDRIRH